MDSSAVPTPSEGMSSPTPPSPEPTADAPELNDEIVVNPRQHPIPPASEPMQYRAIGLVEGVYTPSDDQFTRGNLVTGDGTVIDAVLLGRVMSLVKKHIDLEKPHLWVVYPRTREKGYDLHVQIVGIWEPENLSKQASEETPSESAAESTSSSGLVAIPPKPPNSQEPQDPSDGYFSIRGEILFYSEEHKNLIVRIQQTSKKKDKPPKAFKLLLTGELTGKTVGYFWDFHIQREGNLLVIREGKAIGLVPPRKRKGRPDFSGPGAKKRPPSRKPWKKPTPTRAGEPGSAPPAGAPRDSGPREAPGRPIKRANRPPRESQGDQG
ncbi:MULTISPECIES: hypothetical protein [unclassified Leptolyngbya]|uniref:hypothetical protein n=1 Tax=unclassified Leptolyngbya TaxID=2650499 RepID=UPI001683E818|nr:MULTISPECIES: hypothetical protein [unclassified Leptolyngbya]MBD1911167.1 hypothetical protein [Leptolyngbya sp. FACHB-8]MBD2154822.1 hypothetical protein [Leptolyngbya sp. FACHB-16]